jgi:hypothetical protein
MEHQPFYTKLTYLVLKTGETFDQALAAVQAEQNKD